MVAPLALNRVIAAAMIRYMFAFPIQKFHNASVTFLIDKETRAGANACIKSSPALAPAADEKETNTTTIYLQQNGYKFYSIFRNEGLHPHSPSSR
jgi:hypothetical protein